jgi:predicted secreted Zn-dependent protease
VNALAERVSVMQDHDRNHGAAIILMLQKIARIEEALKLPDDPPWQKKEGGG